MAMFRQSFTAVEKGKPCDAIAVGFTSHIFVCGRNNQQQSMQLQFWTAKFEVPSATKVDIRYVWFGVWRVLSLDALFYLCMVPSRISYVVQIS